MFSVNERDNWYSRGVDSDLGVDNVTANPRRHCRQKVSVPLRHTARTGSGEALSHRRWAVNRSGRVRRRRIVLDSRLTESISVSLMS